MVDLFPDWRSGIDRILKAMKIDSSSSNIITQNDVNGSKDDTLTINLSGVYWNDLLKLVDQQKCVPFIGPNAYSFPRDNGQPWIPSNIQIAKEWIKEHDYPFGGSDLLEKCIQELGFSQMAHITWQGWLNFYP